MLFAVQFFGSLLLDAEADRILNIALSGVYIALAVVQFVRQRHLLARTVRDGLVTPFDELEEPTRRSCPRTVPGTGLPETGSPPDRIRGPPRTRVRGG